ncbi:MAG TPA: maleylpyruvate isomerase N-terminal domain-containing protein [Candidatus Binatia bacterium]|nr:maleylpyruvate isomerase N-terminal domain-containing protein [Candidatus Binatia bacterium]
MSVDRSHQAQNDKERARLEALVGRLSDADLQRPMPEGWTVAGVLAHLAFWDQRTYLLLDHWQRERVTPPGQHEADTDWINDAAKPMFLALPPRRAAELAVAIAEATDHKVAALPDDVVSRNAALGSPVTLARFNHRRTHLDEIERTLKG